MNTSIIWIFRFITGVLFIFSGVIKSNDILGFAYKLEDYFAVFGTTFLNPVSTEMAMGICLLEIFLGVSLLLGSIVVFTVNTLLAMIVFFTFLTFYSAYTGKVTDCGCFGDAIPLTPWQSFYKDVILLIFIGYMYRKKRLIKPVFKPGNARTLLWGLTGLSFVFTLYTTWYLPVWDFRPYEVGKDIQEQMELPEDAQEPVYETRLLYKNKESGEVQAFTTDNIPDGDKWEWQDTENKLIQEGDEPAILNFALFNPAGEMVTDAFLNQSGYRLMIVQYDLDKSNLRGQEKVNELIRELKSDFKEGENIWALTSSGAETRERYTFEHDLPYDYYTADAVLLKTIIRSNPGLLLLEDNKIVGKWPATRLPDSRKILSLMK